MHRDKTETPLDQCYNHCCLLMLDQTAVSVNLVYAVTANYNLLMYSMLLKELFNILRHMLICFHAED